MAVGALAFTVFACSDETPLAANGREFALEARASTLAIPAKTHPETASSWDEAVCNALFNWRIDYSVAVDDALGLATEPSRSTVLSAFQSVQTANKQLLSDVAAANGRADAPFSAIRMADALKIQSDRVERATTLVETTTDPIEFANASTLLLAFGYGFRQAALLVEGGQPDSELAALFTKQPACGAAFVTQGVPIGYTQQPGVSPGATREVRWAEDIDFVDRWMFALHAKSVALQTRGPVPLMHTRLAELKTKISGSTDAELLLELQTIVTLLGEVHTGLDILGPGRTLAALPLHFHWFADGLYVTYTDGPNHQDLIGKQVVFIGQQPAVTVLASISKVMPRENDPGIQAMVGDYMRSLELLQTTGVTVENDTVKLTFADGTIRSIVASRTGQGLSQDTSPDPAWLKRPGRDDTAYVQRKGDSVYFRLSVILPVAGGVTQPLLETLTSEAAKPETSRLIVDLRADPGGFLPTAEAVFQSISKIRESQPNLKMFVLIDGGTLSAAQYLAIRLRGNLRIPLVGNLSGEAPNPMYIDVHAFVTPNIGISVTYSAEEYRAGFGGGGLIPDVRITLSGEDYFAKNDPVLNYALSN